MRKQKTISFKKTREFLKKKFPENIRPIKKLPKKDKELVRKKERSLLEIEKNIKIFEKKFFKRNFYKTKTLRKSALCFLYSSDFIKLKFLKIQNKNKILSDFLQKLKEIKKFSLLYGGISRKFFQKAFNNAKKNQGRTNENLIIEFERRLDVLLYRICFFKSISSARQAISHNLVLINGIIVNISSYQVKRGDLISINIKKKKH